MPRFRYRLQKVLDYREDKEKQFRRELSGAQRSLARAVYELNALQERLALACQQSKMPVPDPEQYLIMDRYLARLNRDIREQEEVVTACGEEVARKTEAVQNAVRDRKTLGLHREKNYSDFCRSLELQEQKQNDEYALFGYNRRM